MKLSGGAPNLLRERLRLLQAASRHSFSKLEVAKWEA